MNYYSIALFIHIVAALGFFVSLAVDWLSLQRLRHALNIEQVQEWIRISTGVRGFSGASTVTLLVAGFYMMAVAQIGDAWLIVTFGSVVLLIVLEVVLTRPRMVAIRRAVPAANRPVSPTLHDLLHNPLLWVSIQMRVMIALGIVFHMTVKPDLSGSLLTIGIAIILGFTSALPILLRQRAPEAPTT